MHHVTRYSLFIGSLFTLALASACSDSSSATEATSRPSTTADPGAGGAVPGAQDPQQAALDYAACMRDNGLEDYPDPVFDSGRVVIGGDGVDPNDPDFAAADEHCAPMLAGAAGGFEAPTGDELEEFQEGMLAFAECMRGQGLDFPDPNFDDDGRVVMRNQLDPGDPKVVEARDACQDLLPRPGTGS